MCLIACLKDELLRGFLHGCLRQFWMIFEVVLFGLAVVGRVLR